MARRAPRRSPGRARLMRPGTLLTLVPDAAGVARLTLSRRTTRRPVASVQPLLDRLQRTLGVRAAAELLRRACRPEALRSGRQRGLSLDPVIDSRPDAPPGGAPAGEETPCSP